MKAKKTKKAIRQEYQRNYERCVYLSLNVQDCEAFVFSSCRKMYLDLLNTVFIKKFCHIPSYKEFRQQVKSSHCCIKDFEGETQLVCTKDRIR